MKKYLLALIAVPALMALPGCTDEEAAAGVGFVGGLVVGSSVGHHYGSPYRSCSGYYGYRGGYYNQCRNVGYYNDYDYGYGGWGWKANAVNADQKTVSPRAEKFAKRYHTGLDGAQKVVTAFDRGAKGDMGPFNRMGLNETEMAAIYNGSMPSAGAVETMSKTLDLAPAQTRKVLRSIVNTVQEQRRTHGR